MAPCFASVYEQAASNGVLHMPSWKLLPYQSRVLLGCLGVNLCLTGCDALRPEGGHKKPDFNADYAISQVAESKPQSIPETISWVWTDSDRQGWGFGSATPKIFTPPSGGFGLRSPSEPEFPDVLIRSQPLSIEGRDYDRVLIDLECFIPAAVNDLTIYYSTPNHGELTDFRALPSESSPLLAGERRLLVYDMSILAAGNDDWTNSSIQKLRFDLPQGADSEYVIYSIRICNSASPDCH